MSQPVVLMILDGYGLRGETAGNAIAAARRPNLEALWRRWPHATLGASGLDVGLPDGQMGNSEVGHTNIGAGRVVYQELTRISKAIADGDFFQNPALCAACDGAARTGGRLHLMGLLSDGGVHSHIDHLLALLALAQKRGVRAVSVHCLMDGRDTDPHSGEAYLARLQGEIDRLGVGEISTVIGRYYAMDRDKRWERVSRAYAALVEGEGAPFTDAAAAAKASYAEGVTDEFIEPAVRAGYPGVADGDAVVFYNFRPDRAREITRAMVDPAFDGFAARQPMLSDFVCLTGYDATMPNVSVAFPPQSLENTLGEVLEKAGKTQLRIAETEKYAHVTFFFNGGTEEPFPRERRVLVASPKVATYDLQPEMSAYEVTGRLLDDLDAHPADFVVLNYANCDMVGHTGVFEAAVRAVEAVDDCAGRVGEAVLALGGRVLITADHGNADEMQNPDGSPMTAHTTNRVPIIAAGCDGALRENGILADLAPTVLGLMGLPQPAEMTGRGLFNK